MIKPALLLVALTAFTVLTTSYSWSAPPSPAVKQEMGKVYAAFKALQPYIWNEKEFLNPNNSKAISRLIATLRDEFQAVKAGGHKQLNEPGFATTLAVLSSMLKDASNRFDEDKKGYALWRLRTTANHCITCHTRSQVEVSFFDSTSPNAKLDPLAQAEFYLATRQFENAKQAFLTVAKDPRRPAEHIEALQKWLVVTTRVQPNPAQALASLDGLIQGGHLNSLETELVNEWRGAFKRWLKAGSGRGDAVQQAAKLLQQATQGDEFLPGDAYAVELLRASALLHDFLEKYPANPGRSEALYLLGLTYSKLPLIFVNELPELFLEQCIREFPNTPNARKAYRLYREVVTLGFTGSSGTHMPDDVMLTLQELHNLAYGVPRFQEQL